MEFRNYNFSKTKVTASVRDGNYLWIAFLGSGGDSILRKVSAFDLEQVYYELTVPVDEITRMKISGDNLYLSFDDDTYIGGYYDSTNPLSTSAYLNKPVSITEKAVDLVYDNSAIFFLIPGAESGTNTKVLKFVSDTLDDTIDLSTVNNASSMTVDENNNLFIVTNENPTKLVRVYEESGGTYSSESWTIE